MSFRPYGTEAFYSTLTQDCATLVLGYYRFSLREKDRRLFHPPWAALPVDDWYKTQLPSSSFID